MFDRNAVHRYECRRLDKWNEGSDKKVTVMSDIMFVLIAVAFFAVGASFVRGCDKLSKEE
jgi:hypothetical protein